MFILAHWINVISKLYLFIYLGLTCSCVLLLSVFFSGDHRQSWPFFSGKIFLFFLFIFSSEVFRLLYFSRQTKSELDLPISGGFQQILVTSSHFRWRPIFSSQNLPSFEHRPESSKFSFISFFSNQFYPSVCPLFFCFYWFKSALLFYISYSQKKICCLISAFHVLCSGFLTFFFGFICFILLSLLFSPCSLFLCFAALINCLQFHLFSRLFETISLKNLEVGPWIGILVLAFAYWFLHGSTVYLVYSFVVYILVAALVANGELGSCLQLGQGRGIVVARRVRILPN